MNIKNIHVLLVAILLLFYLENTTNDAHGGLSWKVNDVGTNLSVIAQTKPDTAATASENNPARTITLDPRVQPSPEIDDTAENCLYRLWPGFGHPDEAFSS